MNRKRALTSILALLVAWLAQGSAACAQDSQTGWRGRVWAGAVGRYVLTDNEAFAADPFGTIALQVDGSAFGFGGDVEYKLSRHFGIDTAIAYASLPVTFQSSVTPSITQKSAIGFVPVFVSLNVHVISNKKVDIWIGPQLAYVFFTDKLAFPVPPEGTYHYDPANVFSPLGFSAGTDISLTEKLALNLAFRWENADARLRRPPHDRPGLRHRRLDVPLLSDRSGAMGKSATCVTCFVGLLLALGTAAAAQGRRGVLAAGERLHPPPRRDALPRVHRA